MSLKTKKSIEGFLRKSDFKFFPYLTMAGNWSKITKESMWKRTSIDKWHQYLFFPIPPLRKKGLTFLIGTVISMGKGKKWISLLTYRKSTSSFSQWNDCTHQKSRDIFFLKGGMGKKSYYCNMSIQALFHKLYLVILLQFLAIAK